jgi:hypothetical protein
MDATAYRHVVELNEGPQSVHPGGISFPLVYYPYFFFVDFIRKELLNLADQGVSALVGKLYAGQGTWGCLYPNGSLITVRHVIDFAYISNLLQPGDIPLEIASQMAAFVFRELIASEWMRALSLSDVIAPVSRPDHGSDGAYPAWPAMTAYGLSVLANQTAALNFVRSCSRTMRQGPIGQANQLPGTPGGEAYTQPFKTNLGFTRYTALAGGAFAELVLSNVITGALVTS